MPVSKSHLLAMGIGVAMLFSSAAMPAFAQDAAAPGTVVATVNGSEITEADLELAQSDLNQQFQQLPAEQRRAAALSALIEIRLLAAESTKAGVADEEDFKRRMDFLRERALHSAYVENQIAGSLTDEAVRARYDQEVANTPAANEVKAAHILVETEEEAKEIIVKLDGGADFAELAKEHSKDGAAQNGGDLGYFGPGRMVPEFEQAAMALEVGAYTKEPVQSQFGWHIIKVDDRRAQQPPAFDQVSDQIRSIMLRDTYLQKVGEVREAAEVEIADEALRAAIEGEEEPASEAAPSGETPQQ